MRRGVATIPISPDMEALNIAEVILPLAIETITTEEDTVEGKLAKKKIESHTNW
jgi:hypothetical protein